MNQESSSFSLQNDVSEAIGHFLYAEGFASCDITPQGILLIINQISDYYEEGAPLFPEVILTNDYQYFQTFPSRNIIIKETTLNIEEFANVLKLCAPLALDNWVVFIEIKDKKMKYGLINAELNDTSPSIYNQTVGTLGIPVKNTTIAYIRNVGFKNVELVGFKKKKVISLNLNNVINTSNAEINILAEAIVENISEKQEAIKKYFEKTISNAIKTSHGNLIGIVSDVEKSIEFLKKTESDGVYLDNSINISELVVNVEQDKTSEQSIELRNNTSVFASMLNHDGITVITTKGRIIGYHLFITNHILAGQTVVGGARTRAFASMKNSNLFKVCFFKSQDGNLKIWSNNV